MNAVNLSSGGYDRNNLPANTSKNNRIFMLLDESAKTAPSSPIKAHSSSFSIKIKIIIGLVVSILLAAASVAVVLAYFLTRNNCKCNIFFFNILI